MRKILKILKITVLSVVLLFTAAFGAAAVYLWLNEQKIYAAAVDEINKTQAGLLEVAYLDVRFFANFPYISAGLHGIDFYENKAKDTPAVIHIDDAYVGFDIMDILRGAYNIKKLKIKDGHARLVIDENGLLNLNSALADTRQSADTADSPPVQFDLQAITVENFRIEETNLQGDKYINVALEKTEAEFSNLAEFIRVNFRGDLELTEYTASEVTYFKDKPFSLDTRFTYDLVAEMLTLFPGKLLLEQGSLDFEGSMDFADDLFLDLDFYGEKRNFDVFISFVPDDIAETLRRFRNEGEIFFKGKIFGRSLNADPAVDIELGCANTFFFHKDKSKAVKDLQFSGRFHTGADNNLETAEFILSNLYGIPESGEFRGTLRVVNFLNPMVSMDFHADLELENFQSFYNPDWLEDAEGNVKIDITINEFADQDSVIHIASKMEDGTLSRIEFRGASLKLSDYPHRLRNLGGKIVLDGDNLLMEGLSAKVGDSDLLMTASLGHLNAIAHKQSAVVDFSLHIESNKIDIGSLLPEEMIGPEVWKREVITDLFADFDLTTTVDELNSYTYFPAAELTVRNFRGRLEGFDQPLHRISGKVNLTDKKITADDLTLVIGENDLHLDLLLDDPYLFIDTRAEGAAHFHGRITADRIDTEDFLYYRGEPLLDTAVMSETGDVRIRNLRFACEGYVHPATISPHGWLSYADLEEFTVQINDLPKLRNAKGRFRTDTTGCLYIDGFSARLGRSDYRADLKLLHLLDSLGDQRKVLGSVGGDLWDFDEYLTPKAETVMAEEASQEEVHAADLNIFAYPFPVADVELTVREMISDRYKLGEVRGRFRADRDHTVRIDTLSFRAADGTVGISGYLNGSDQNNLYLKGKLALYDVDIDQVFFKFDNFGQDYLVSEQVHGRITGTVDVKSYLYPDLTPKLDRTEALVNMKIREGRLENFAPMQAMSDFMGNKNLNNIRFGELENSFEFNNGTLTVPRMKIASTLGYIFLSGNQDLENRINYEVQVPLSLVQSAGWNMLRNKIRGGAARRQSAEELAETSEEEIISEQTGLIRRYMTFNITGTTENFEVGLGRKKSLP